MNKLLLALVTGIAATPALAASVVGLHATPAIPFVGLHAVPQYFAATPIDMAIFVCCALALAGVVALRIMKPAFIRV